MSWAADLIKAQDGDVIIIPVVLARALGLPAAAFYRQAAYLSAVVEDQHGWFFLEQQGPGDPSGKTIFERLGSWQSAIGIGPDAQVTIRRQLRTLGLLEETRKGMVHGALLYRADGERYLNFLATCSKSPLYACRTRQTGSPDCTNPQSGLSNPGKSGCTNRENPVDVYQDDLPNGLQSTTTTTPRAPALSGGGLCDDLEIEPVITQYFPQLLDILRREKIEDSAYAQDLLDELAGTIESAERGDRAKVGNPILWFQKLASGEFKRARCFDIQSRRRIAALASDRQKSANTLLEIDPSIKAKGDEFFAGIARRLREQQNRI